MLLSVNTYSIIKLGALLSKVHHYKFYNLFNNFYRAFIMRSLRQSSITINLHEIFHFRYNCSTKFLFAQLIYVISYLKNQFGEEEK